MIVSNTTIKDVSLICDSLWEEIYDFFTSTQVLVVDDCCLKQFFIILGFREIIILI